MRLSTHNQKLSVSAEVAASLRVLARKHGCSTEQALQMAISIGLERLESSRSEAGKASAEPVMPALSPRQRQILPLLEAGYTVKEIAGKIGVSETTVRKHVSRLRTLE